MDLELSLETIGEMDGGELGRRFDEAIKAAHSDCERRPWMKKPRHIKLQVEIVPVRNNDGTFKRCAFTAKLDPKVPPYQPQYPDLCKASASGGLLFDPNPPDDDRDAPAEPVKGKLKKTA